MTGDEDQGTSLPLRKIVFLLELPEPIAIANGSTFTLHFNQPVAELQDIAMQPLAHLPPLPDHLTGNLFVSFRFWQVDYRQSVSMADAWDPVVRQALPPHLHAKSREETATQPPRFDLRRTVIEAVTPIFTRNPDTDVLTEAFERCLKCFNEMRAAYSVAAHTGLPRLNCHHLPFIVPYVTADLIGSDGWDDHLSLFHLHWNPPIMIPRDPLNDEEMRRFMVMFQRVRKGDPLMLYADRAARAWRAVAPRWGLRDGGDRGGNRV